MPRHAFNQIIKSVPCHLLPHMGNNNLQLLLCSYKWILFSKVMLNVCPDILNWVKIQRIGRVRKCFTTHSFLTSIQTWCTGALSSIMIESFKLRKDSGQKSCKGLKCIWSWYTVNVMVVPFGIWKNTPGPIFPHLKQPQNMVSADYLFL